MRDPNPNTLVDRDNQQHGKRRNHPSFFSGSGSRAGNLKSKSPTIEVCRASKTKPHPTPPKDHNARDKQLDWTTRIRWFPTLDPVGNELNKNSPDLSPGGEVKGCPTQSILKCPGLPTSLPAPIKIPREGWNFFLPDRGGHDINTTSAQRNTTTSPPH